MGYTWKNIVLILNIFVKAISIGMFNKYIIRQKIEEKSKQWRIFSISSKRIFIRKTDFIGKDEILLDKIDDESVLIWYFKNSDIGNHLYLYGFFDKEEIDLIKNIVNSTDVVLDVGSNIGYHSLMISKIIGNKGKIYAFEPYDKNFAILHKNILLNNTNNIKLNNIALGDKNMKGSLKVFKDYAYNSLLNLKRLPQVGTEKVRMEQLDTFVYKRKINRIDLIKIDVEGFELNVLKGAKRTLREYKPKIVCEIFQENLNPLGIKVRDVIDYILAFGYKGFLISKEKLIPVGRRKYFNSWNFYFKPY